MMSSLEFSLKVFVKLECVSHFIIHEIFIWDLQRNKELSSISFTSQIGQARNQPVKNVLKSFLFSVDNIATEVRVEITRISENFQKATDAFFCFFLGFFLHIYCFMGFIEVGENFVNEFDQFNWRLVVEFDHAQVAHEWRSV